MKRQHLLALEHAHDTARDALAALRDLLQPAEEGERTHNQVQLGQARDELRSAFAALDLTDKHLAQLRCDVAPCDRVDGACPKCEGTPL